MVRGHRDDDDDDGDSDDNDDDDDDDDDGDDDDGRENEDATSDSCWRILAVIPWASREVGDRGFQTLSSSSTVAMKL